MLPLILRLDGEALAQLLKDKKFLYNVLFERFSWVVSEAMKRMASMEIDFPALKSCVAMGFVAKCAAATVLTCGSSRAMPESVR